MFLFTTLQTGRPKGTGQTLPIHGDGAGVVPGHACFPSVLFGSVLGHLSASLPGAPLFILLVYPGLNGLAPRSQTLQR